MSHWQKIREAANNLRREIIADADSNGEDLHSAAEIIDRAAEHLELDLIPEHPDSNNLQKALAVLEDDCVYFNNKLKHWYKLFCIAHEIGHFVLHHQSVHCTREEISDGVSAADGEANSAIEKLIGYGAGMRREREANLFALEFLLPCAGLKQCFLEKGLSARQIAEKTGLPAEAVSSQLARALLVPESKILEEEKEKNIKFELDSSQRRAAIEAKCPTLIVAGPGTGKTQTLTKRIEHLLETGTDAKRVLALTFSNKAAEEMRERISRTNGQESAAKILVMTFHAYGLDLLRTYWQEAGLDSHSNLLDKIDALLYLENNLNFLDLEHYQVLHDPTANLAAILGAISRAKDELCGAGEYKILGEKMLARSEESGDEELKTKAQKVLETARVYEFYEEFLKKEKLLDFGDLIFRAVKLLRENEQVKREVCAKYDAILVDEFQDVNRACGMLLKEIAGCGSNLWAVGDLRQSIYRWRGASPANISLFGEDFPNAETVSLETNYRSQREIIESFGSFAKQMKAAAADFFHSWQANREAVANENEQVVTFEICDSIETEAARIADNITQLRDKGFAYKDCAVICRTHGQLGKFAKSLSQKGIPIFYLGELFEREEVRDLLALLDLKFSTDGHSLVRVAQFPEYRIPVADTLKIIAALKESQKTFTETHADENIKIDLSEEGKAGVLKLARQLSSFPPDVSAWSFLANYLFAESDYLKTLFATESANNQSGRLAVYQFLRLAQSTEERFAEKSEKPAIVDFLNYVKKLAVFNEDKNYAQIPAEAETLDAVRLLTVHSAKGLEFPAVFLPYLGKGKIPSNRQAQTCPNPDQMIAAGEADFHDEEEECLFFVAMSRARDFLYLSRAEDYSKNDSRFLEMLAEVLPAPVKMISAAGAPPHELVLPETLLPQKFYAAELDRFLRCGRDYFYTHVLGLKAAGDKSIYRKFHLCVYDTIRSMQMLERLENIELTEAVALERLNEFWQAAGLDAHPYAPIYRARADEIIRRVCSKMEKAISPNEITRPTYELKLQNGVVRIRFDALELIENENGETQAVIRKYKTGKSPKDVKVEDADVLMTVAVQENFPDAKTSLQKIYLSDETTEEVPITAQVIKNRISKYEKAIDDIKMGKFEAAPKEKDACPFCPHFFICPSGGS